MRRARLLLVVVLSSVSFASVAHADADAPAPDPRHGCRPARGSDVDEEHGSLWGEYLLDHRREHRQEYRRERRDERLERRHDRADVRPGDPRKERLERRSELREERRARGVRRRGAWLNRLAEHLQEHHERSSAAPVDCAEPVR